MICIRVGEVVLVGVMVSVSSSMIIAPRGCLSMLSSSALSLTSTPGLAGRVPRRGKFVKLWWVCYRCTSDGRKAGSQLNLSAKLPATLPDRRVGRIRQ